MSRRFRILGMVVFVVLVASSFVWTGPAYAAYGDQMLKKGNSGADVRTLQQDLKDVGYSLAVDGQFGPQTEGVVKQFQEKRQLLVDGIVGPQTFEALAAERRRDESAEGKRDSESSRGGSVPRASSSDSEETPQEKDDALSQEQVLDELYEFAAEFLGTPYRYGGTGKSGIDCSSLSQQALSRLGVGIPRTTASQHRQGTAVERSKLQAGDLVFFSTTGPGATHVAVYLENGKLLNATSSGGVTYTQLSHSYWNGNYYGARRFFSEKGQ